MLTASDDDVASYKNGGDALPFVLPGTQPRRAAVASGPGGHGTASSGGAGAGPTAAAAPAMPFVLPTARPIQHATNHRPSPLIGSGGAAAAGAGASGTAVHTGRSAVAPSTKPASTAVADAKAGAGAGGNRAHPVVFEWMRDDYLRFVFVKHAPKFVRLHNTQLFCGSWNVNGRNATSDLRSWLLPPADPSEPPLAAKAPPRPNPVGIYALGFQEVVPLNATSMFSEKLDFSGWRQHLETVLSPEEYIQIGSEYLVGVLLMLYVRRDQLAFISDLEFDSVGVGLLGVAGNKGGVSFRFQYHDTTICIVNSHLAASQNNVMARNDNVAKLASQLTFKNTHSMLITEPKTNTAATTAVPVSAAVHTVTGSTSHASPALSGAEPVSPTAAATAVSAPPVAGERYVHNPALLTAATATKPAATTPPAAATAVPVPIASASSTSATVSDSKSSPHAADATPKPAANVNLLDFFSAAPPTAAATPIAISPVAAATKSAAAPFAGSGVASAFGSSPPAPIVSTPAPAPVVVSNRVPTLPAPTLALATITPSARPNHRAVAAKLEARSFSRSGGGRRPDSADIYDHEHVFWFGDLNYRLNIERHETIFEHIEAKNYDELLKYDQLNIQRQAGRVFNGFVEAPITFAPTYKYRVGTNQYSFAPKDKTQAALSELSEKSGSDSISAPAPTVPTVSLKAQKKQDKKRRAPAWCDRVLYCGRSRLDVNNLCDALDCLEAIRTAAGVQPQHALTYVTQHMRMLTHLSMAYYPLPPRCVQLSYGRTELHDSDHKPISARYRLVVSIIDTDRQRAVYDAATSKADKWACATIPSYLAKYSDAFTRTERAKIAAQRLEEADRSAKGSDVVLEGMGAVGTGMVGAATAFTGGLSRGLASLTMDEDYIREHTNDSDKRRGVLRGVRAFGMGLVHGVSGLLVDPYQGAKKDGVKGFFKGVGKGLIGVVVKPASGALDLGTNAIQGLHDAGSAAADLARGNKEKGGSAGGAGPSSNSGAGNGSGGSGPKPDSSKQPVASLNALAATTALSSPATPPGRHRSGVATDKTAAAPAIAAPASATSFPHELMSEVVRLTVAEFVRLDTRERTRLCWNLHLLYMHRLALLNTPLPAAAANAIAAAAASGSAPPAVDSKSESSVDSAAAHSSATAAALSLKPSVDEFCVIGIRLNKSRLMLVVSNVRIVCFRVQPSNVTPESIAEREPQPTVIASASASAAAGGNPSASASSSASRAVGAVIDTATPPSPYIHVTTLFEVQLSAIATVHAKQESIVLTAAVSSPEATAAATSPVLARFVVECADAIQSADAVVLLSCVLKSLGGLLA